MKVLRVILGAVMLWSYGTFLVSGAIWGLQSRITLTSCYVMVGSLVAGLFLLPIGFILTELKK